MSARPPLERLLSHVRHEDGHWLWTASKNRHGHGWFRLENPPAYATHAHIAAWRLLVGVIDPGECVLHLCGRSDCCFPGHLMLAPRPWGHPTAALWTGRLVLTPADERRIRRLVISGWRPKQLATRFGVSRAHIGRVARWGTFTFPTPDELKAIEATPHRGGRTAGSRRAS